MPLSNDLILLTRPRDASLRMERALREASDVELTIEIAPLVEIVYEAVSIKDDFDVAIFTSSHGVSGFAALAQSNNRQAFCVGERTAEMARRAGFDAISANGDATALLELMLRQRNLGKIRHFRGAQVHTDIVANLVKSGFQADAQIIYTQKPRNFGESTIQKLQRATTIKTPLFSRQTAIQFDQQNIITDNCDIFCMSSDVKAGLTSKKYRNIAVIYVPTLNSMIAAILSEN